MAAKRGVRSPGTSVYFNTASWEFIDLPDDASEVPDTTARGRLIRVPPLVPIIFSPLAGLLFVIFVPLVGVASLVLVIWRRINSSVNPRHRMRLKEQHR